MHGWVEFKETITVPTGTLDEFCAQRGIPRIDFIQMDVQGAEQLVLLGATAMLRHTTAIWLEVAAQELYKGQALDQELTLFMRARGFALGHTAYLGNATGEGDHLYLNLRHPRVWPYLLSKNFSALRTRVRAFLGRLRRALLNRPGPKP